MRRCKLTTGRTPHRGSDVSRRGSSRGEITKLAARIKTNFDIDATNLMLHDANILNAILGKPERYKMIPYPKS